MKKLTYASLLLSWMLFSCNSNGTKVDPISIDLSAINDSLTYELQQAYEQEAVIGFSVAIVDEDGLIYDNGYGYMDLEQTKKYTSSTIQNIGSISKTLIGVSVLKAQDLGKLSLNDPINDYLPFDISNPEFPDNPILIKHLAYHTSSIIDLDEIYGKSYVLEKSVHDDTEGVFGFFNKPETKISLMEYIENCLTTSGKWYTNDIFSNSKPGENREYSNIGAALCAQIIESATGQSYRSFTKDYILEPLHMTSSGWSSEDIDTSMRSKLFVDKEMTVADYFLITYADGGFITSSKDLGLFLSELIKGYKGSGTLLTQKSYAKLFERQKYTNVESGEEYGIFMEFSEQFIRVKDNLIGHNGSDPGVTTGMYFNPDFGTGKIMIVNTDGDFDDNYWPELQSIWKSLIKYQVGLDSLKASQ